MIIEDVQEAQKIIDNFNSYTIRELSLLWEKQTGTGFTKNKIKQLKEVLSLGITNANLLKYGYIENETNI